MQNQFCCISKKTWDFNYIFLLVFTILYNINILALFVQFKDIFYLGPEQGDECIELFEFSIMCIIFVSINNISFKF